MIFLLTLFFACTPAPAPVDPARPCDAYLSEPDVYAVCVSRTVTQQRDIHQAALVCDALPAPGNLSCRAGWVQVAATQPQAYPATRSELLEFCAGSTDCAFYVLDQRVEGTALEQIQACADRTGRMAGDCAGHAVERFLRTRPDDDTLRAVLAGPLSDVLARKIPTYLVCSGRTVCPDLGAASARCASDIGKPINPGVCEDMLAPVSVRRGW
jgi:hypothetical protein